MAAAAAAVVLLSGCSAGGQTQRAADHVTQAFARAVADGDGTAACALLTDAAREDVGTRTQELCAEGIVQLDLPTPSGAHKPSAYGRAAVVQDGDASLFLVRSGTTWLVRAAGCTPEAQAPFDCVVDGS